ncbi:DUF6221 family protein [Streptomyces sp. NPDC056352]|uniref:DUF6221 family protein n=1 Tax=Streptomyces sp. NPDC056352 TaxID=3345791 RepID=UPI0035D93C22
MTDDLVQFLRDRLDEDYEAAQGAALHAASEISAVARKADVHSPPYSGAKWINDYDHVFVTDGRPGQPRKVMIADCGNGAFGLTPHIARHDPARVLREVEAKRQTINRHSPVPGSDGQAHDTTICDACSAYDREDGVQVGQQYPCDTIRLLTLPYADHPDYRSDWASDQA